VKAHELINSGHVHEAGLNSGLANAIRLVSGNGKITLLPDELVDAQTLLDVVRIALAASPTPHPGRANNVAHTTIAHLVAIRHHLLLQRGAEAAPEPEAA
jgi:hypothetical protein